MTDTKATTPSISVRAQARAKRASLQGLEALPLDSPPRTYDRAHRVSLVTQLADYKPLMTQDEYDELMEEAARENVERRWEKKLIVYSLVFYLLYVTIASLSL
jgi:hypothetical protein